MKRRTIPSIISHYNPFFQPHKWCSYIGSVTSGLSPTSETISTISAGDSCWYEGRRYLIFRMGSKITILIDIAEYIRSMLSIGPSIELPKGFKVSTTQVYHVEYNTWLN